jgi:hypothetical protein
MRQADDADGVENVRVRAVPGDRPGIHHRAQVQAAGPGTEDVLSRFASIDELMSISSLCRFRPPGCAGSSWRFQMDVTEASAMTEASGLVGEQLSAPLGPASFSDQLRRLTREAPLQSLLMAFLLGILFARRG